MNPLPTLVKGCLAHRLVALQFNLYVMQAAFTTYVVLKTLAEVLMMTVVHLKALGLGFLLT